MKKTCFFASLTICLSVACYFIGRSGLGLSDQYTDTIYVEKDEICITPYLDSIPTQSIMEDALVLNYINYKDSPFRGELVLFQREDLEYLPYLFLTFSSSVVPSLDVEAKIYDYIVMCSARYDDKALFEIGRQAVEKLNKRIEARPEKAIYEPGGYTRYYKQHPVPYYESFSTNNAEAYQEVFFTPSNIDTLRVNVIAHNDRRALGQLEKYYKEIGYDLGIAIYYKALLCRDGNGDLAERLYRVLKPYFGERPELKNAAHDALVRAAICDHNQRAKELCDSLGYSLCDYKVR